jgi:hypothetical protein
LLANTGIYVLYEHSEVYYIGRATRLSTRLKTHLRPGGRYSEHWTHANIYAIPIEANVAAIETVMISSIRSWNAARPKIKKIPIPSKVHWQVQK